MENPHIHTKVIGFHIDSKSWFMTWPRCPLSKEECLALLESKGKDITGMVICRELHEVLPSDPPGMVPYHLHAYVLLAKRLNCRNPRFWDLGEYHGRYEHAKSIDHVVKYIKKDGDILEHGAISWAEKLDSKKERRRYLGKRLIDGEPLESVVRDDPSLIFGFRHLSQDVLSWRSHTLKMFDKEDVRGIWIWGPPRIGKSYFVRQNYPSLYLKAQNRWWDNYQGESTVLIDDFDRMGTCLSHYLKIWADRYGCTGEVKGGHTPLVYDEFIITSNYSIDKLFPPEEDEDLNLAIKSRFKVIHMVNRDLGLDGYKLKKTTSRRSRSQSP